MTKQEDWREQFQQEWSLSEKDQKAAELAKRYHDETEAYDRTVCTGPILLDGIQPADVSELALINWNARRLRLLIAAEAAKHGISDAELGRAISHHAMRKLPDPRAGTREQP